MIESFAISLILTLIIELTISYIIGIRKKNDIEIIVLVNILTNPIVVFISNISNQMLDISIYYIIVIFLEICAFFIEAQIFKKLLNFQKISAIKISLINNIASYSIGVLIGIIRKII